MATAAASTQKNIWITLKTIGNAKRQPKFASIVFGPNSKSNCAKLLGQQNAWSNQYCFYFSLPLCLCVSLSLFVCLSVVQMNNLASQINEINVHGPGPKPNGNICTLCRIEGPSVREATTVTAGWLEPLGHSGELVIELKWLDLRRVLVKSS